MQGIQSNEIVLSLVILGVYYCEKNDFDEIAPCELSDNDLAVISAAYESKQAEAMKVWTECSVSINSMSTNQV